MFLPPRRGRSPACTVQRTTCAAPTSFRCPQPVHVLVVGLADDLDEHARATALPGSHPELPVSEVIRLRTTLLPDRPAPHARHRGAVKGGT
jgi:hypothetical protein